MVKGNFYDLLMCQDDFPCCLVMTSPSTSPSRWLLRLQNASPELVGLALNHQTTWTHVETDSTPTIFLIFSWATPLTTPVHFQSASYCRWSISISYLFWPRYPSSVSHDTTTLIIPGGGLGQKTCHQLHLGKREPGKLFPDYRCWWFLEDVYKRCEIGEKTGTHGAFRCPHKENSRRWYSFEGWRRQECGWR